MEGEGKRGNQTATQTDPSAGMSYRASTAFNGHQQHPTASDLASGKGSLCARTCALRQLLLVQIPLALRLPSNHNLPQPKRHVGPAHGSREGHED
eukprot:3210614-Rhodomonas_salina.1